MLSTPWNDKDEPSTALVDKLDIERTRQIQKTALLRATKCIKEYERILSRAHVQTHRNLNRCSMTMILQVYNIDTFMMQMA
jgi:hypothetical protein